MIGIKVPSDKKIMILELDSYGKDELLCREKLCVVTNLIAYAGEWEECVHIAKSNLLIEGAGHSADIYTSVKAHEMHAGIELPVCRLIVNMSNLATFGVPYANVGLIPTHGLGCGFWQGNTSGEHINFEHFLNITRMVYNVKSGVTELTTEEVWAE
jgi:succinate-semialdehyde dehydrogenase